MRSRVSLLKLVCTFLHEALKEDKAVDEVSLVEDVETYEVGLRKLAAR